MFLLECSRNIDRVLTAMRYYLKISDISFLQGVAVTILINGGGGLFEDIVDNHPPFDDDDNDHHHDDDDDCVIRRRISMRGPEH